MPLSLVILQAASVAVPTSRDAACAPRADGAIVVCGRAVPGDPYRLPLRGDATPIEPTGPPRAEWGLGGGVRMDVHVENGALPQGALSPRVMTSVKIPF